MEGVRKGRGRQFGCEMLQGRQKERSSCKDAIVFAIPPTMYTKITWTWIQCKFSTCIFALFLFCFPKTSLHYEKVHTQTSKYEGRKSQGCMPSLWNEFKFPQYKIQPKYLFKLLLKGSNWTTKEFSLIQCWVFGSLHAMFVFKKFKHFWKLFKSLSELLGSIKRRHDKFL